MIRLSSELGKRVRDVINRFNNKFGFLDCSNNVSPNTLFTEDELDYIVDLTISKDDIKYLNYFKNLDSLEISLYPSINDMDFIYISNHFNNISNMSINSQNSLNKIDLKKFNNLKNISITNNDNLKDIDNINCCKELFKITLFNNRSLLNIDNIYDLINFNNNLGICELDITYFSDSVNYLKGINKSLNYFSKINWIEATGYRYKNYYTYDYNEINKLFRVCSDSISKYIFMGDGDIERFSIVYDWFVSSVRFLNGDNYIANDNVFKVLKSGYGSRLTYAKAFQFLLSVVGVDSDIVYSYGASDSLGINDGNVLAKLSGNSDYALLRVKIDGRHYYCDIAWDSMIKEQDFYDKLRLVLVSYDELKIRHNLINIDNVKSSSYSNNQIQDLIDFAEERINKVNEMFNTIEQYSVSINSLENKLIKLDEELADLKYEIDNLDEKDELYNNKLACLVKVKEENNKYENELKEFQNKRNDVIYDFKNQLLESYLDIPESFVFDDENREKYSEMIGKMNEYGILSNYVYRILMVLLNKI